MATTQSCCSVCRCAASAVWVLVTQTRVSFDAGFDGSLPWSLLVESAQWYKFGSVSSPHYSTPATPSVDMWPVMAPRLTSFKPYFTTFGSSTGFQQIDPFVSYCHYGRQPVCSSSFQVTQIHLVAVVPLSMRFDL